MKKNRQVLFAATAFVAGAVIVLVSALSAAQAAEPQRSRADSALAEKAATLFGPQAGQSFNAGAVAASHLPPRTDTLTITIAPGKAAQVMTLVDAGQGFAFHWTATGSLLMGMHGEPAIASGALTLYGVGANQRQGSGLLVAPFAGKHGWYWQNQSSDNVTVKVSVTGFQKDLLRAENR